MVAPREGWGISVKLSPRGCDQNKSGELPGRGQFGASGAKDLLHLSRGEALESPARGIISLCFPGL